jgi:thiol-disulfide isomerase/thioredoxin
MAAAAAALALAGCGLGATPQPAQPAAPPRSPTAADTAALEPCPRTRPSSPARGDGLPDIRLPCLGSGPEVRMAGLVGAPRLVNVWASWCPPCRTELPWLQAVAADGVEVLGVDAEDRPDAAAGLLGALGVTFPSVSDPGNDFAQSIGIPAKPTTLFVSPDGEVVHVQVGPFASEAELRREVARYLDGASP